MRPMESGVYRTRGGEIATVTSRDYETDSPYVWDGFIHGEGDPCSWTDSGYCFAKDTPNKFDLVELLRVEGAESNTTVTVTVPKGVNVEIKYAS